MHTKNFMMLEFERIETELTPGLLFCSALLQGFFFTVKKDCQAVKSYFVVDVYENDVKTQANLYVTLHWIVHIVLQKRLRKLYLKFVIKRPLRAGLVYIV